MHTLLRRAIAGSSKAQNELASRFFSELHSYICRQIGPGIANNISASDICQEAFIATLASLPTLASGAELSAFRARLFRTAQWTIRRKAKKLRAPVMEAPFPSSIDEQAPQESTGPVTHKDEARWLRSFFDHLNPKYSDVLRLWCDGASFVTIARRLDLRESTVRKRYHRAIDMLRRMMVPN